MIWITLNKKMKKIRPDKHTWYDWLINYIPEPIKKVLVLEKIKLLVFLIQIDLNKQCMGQERN